MFKYDLENKLYFWLKCKNVYFYFKFLLKKKNRQYNSLTQKIIDYFMTIFCVKQQARDLTL